MTATNRENSKAGDKRDQIRSELEDTRLAFHSLLDKITDEDLNKSSLNSAWSVREVLFHMSFAPQNLPLDVWLIRHFNRVPNIPAGPFNRLNIYLTRRGGGDADREAIATAYDKAHQRTIKTLDSIKAGEWGKGARYPGWDPMLSGFVTLEKLFGYISLHFEAHAREIESVLKTEDEAGLPE